MKEYDTKIKTNFKAKSYKNSLKLEKKLKIKNKTKLKKYREIGRNIFNIN